MGHNRSVFTVIALAVALVVAPVVAKMVPLGNGSIRPVKVRRVTNDFALLEASESVTTLPDNLTHFDGPLAFDMFTHQTISRKLAEVQDSTSYLTPSIQVVASHDARGRCESNRTFSAGNSPLRC